MGKCCPDTQALNEVRPLNAALTSLPQVGGEVIFLNQTIKDNSNG